VDLELSGKTALVTGSHRGTGFIIAEQLLAEGVAVYVHGFEMHQAGRAVAELGAGIAVAGDITSDEGAAALATQIHTPLDILINNYGTAQPGSWEGSSSADWIDLYQKNVLSAQRLIQQFISGMRERGWGRIVNLGTVGSTRPNARMPHYYAAKGALATMTMSLAAEVKGTGIRVNLVSPGLIRTPEVEASYLEAGRRKGWGETFEEIEPRIAADIPIGRLVTREEVANVVVFLASPRAEALHGQNIRVDGGALGTLT
jgi:NAD(P)-dependent dehydrogenase (short-subunit alcohol dehydrogenase family)